MLRIKSLTYPFNTVPVAEIENLFSFSIGKAFVATSVQPFQKDWRDDHGQKEGKLKKSFRDWMIAPVERPSSHNPYQNGEGENNSSRRGFHVLTLSRVEEPCHKCVPDLRLGYCMSIIDQVATAPCTGPDPTMISRHKYQSRGVERLRS